MFDCRADLSQGLNRRVLCVHGRDRARGLDGNARNENVVHLLSRRLLWPLS